MVAPAASPLTRSGAASLRVERVAGQSAAVSSFSTAPMKLLVPRARGSSVWAYTSSFGGGLVAGDQTSLEVEVASGGRCFLGTQSSTKIYRNPRQRPCTHRTQARLRPGAFLCFAPDPVQAFSRAYFTQDQEFRLEADASLVAVDTLSSGRQARGEHWSFAHYSSTLKVHLDERLCFYDTLRLSPEDGSLQEPHRGGRFHGLSTILLWGPAVRSVAQEVLERMANQPVARRGTLSISASPLPDGAVLRMAGEHMELLQAEIRRCLLPCAELLGDNPWIRKW